MAKEPDNILLALLREIRSKQDEQTGKLDTLERRVRHVESQLDDLRITVTYSPGQSSETLKQTKQSAPIDELFARLEELIGKENTP
jgi:exonuclease III